MTRPEAVAADFVRAKMKSSKASLRATMGLPQSGRLVCADLPFLSRGLLRFESAVSKTMVVKAWR